MDRTDYFPELRFSVLERYARRWAKKYKEVIQSIAVYSYSPERIAVYKDLWGDFRVRYALVFGLKSDIDEEALKELASATEQRATIRKGYSALFDNRFFTVYANEPENDYYKHWTMFLKKPNEEMPLGVLVDEPSWVIYESDEETGQTDKELSYSVAGKTGMERNLQPDLFPDLAAIEFIRRVREWVANWPLINEVRLYAGKGTGNPYVLIYLTESCKALETSGFWIDSLVPIQNDLLSLHKNKQEFSLSHWQMFVLEAGDELPLEFINDYSCWNYDGRGKKKSQSQDARKITIQSDGDDYIDDKILWITYSSRMREVMLSDIFGHTRCLSKPNFDGVNDNFMQYVFENAFKTISLKELSEKSIGFDVTLHKIVSELGFKGKLKKLFFQVSKDKVVFSNPVTGKDLQKANIMISKEEIERLFFK